MVKHSSSILKFHSLRDITSTGLQLSIFILFIMLSYTQLFSIFILFIIVEGQPPQKEEDKSSELLEVA